MLYSIAFRILKPVLGFLLLLLFIFGTFVTYKIVSRGAYEWLWLGPHQSEENVGKITDVFLIIVDHWEPGSDISGAKHWLDRYKQVAIKHTDSGGRPLQYTWAYPVDNRNEKILALLSEAVYDGFGEVEVHWHHKHDDEAKFEQDLREGIRDFNKFGAVIHKGQEHARFIFVHGNWALDNSIPESCGISNELEILTRNGAYADFTFPAIGSPAQPRQRGIFRAKDDSGPKSYDTGTVSTVGRVGPGLLIFQGPLGIDFRNPLVLFEYGALDDQELTGFSGAINRFLGTEALWREHRVGNWLRLAPRVVGKPEWAFIKVHAHGMQHADFIFRLIDDAVTTLEKEAVERGLRLHFVTTREAYNLIRAAEEGAEMELSELLDFKIPKPLRAYTKTNMLF